ncbi:hypothetical protein QBC44DRAFT_38363 [Cladorrhinum sp. PSN332]|nr:hypothetical protein QBC44DRAFT_38363 [Cladorrhinum sp. PSN332]
MQLIPYPYTSSSTAGGPFPFRNVLHNYIYRCWFRPWRSEIEYDRFICKLIAPKDLSYEEPPSESAIDTIISPRWKRAGAITSSK